VITPYAGFVWVSACVYCEAGAKTPKKTAKKAVFLAFAKEKKAS
jgi:hypothetical protein